MFCNQCEQVAKGGCTTIGVCGKQSDVSDLQDLLIHALQGLSLYAVEGRKVGISDADINLFTCEGVFSTLTNVNFDDERVAALVRKTVTLREELKEKVKAAGGKVDFAQVAANFTPADSTAEMAKQGADVVLTGNPDEDEDIKSLKLTLLFGLKGMAAGKYDFVWFDTIDGETVTQTGVSVSSGNVTWSKPDSMGSEVALYITCSP